MQFYNPITNFKPNFIHDSRVAQNSASLGMANCCSFPDQLHAARLYTDKG